MTIEELIEKLKFIVEECHCNGDDEIVLYNRLDHSIACLNNITVPTVLFKEDIEVSNIYEMMFTRFRQE